MAYIAAAIHDPKISHFFMMRSNQYARTTNGTGSPGMVQMDHMDRETTS